MPINFEKNDRIDLVSPKSLTKQIDIYQTLNKKVYKTRNQAIRALIEYGLESECKRSPKMKHDMQKALEENQG